MLNMLPMLIQLTEKDKRLLVALFIILIIAFVLIAYIGQGVRAIMRKHGKKIDGYMYDLCKAGLIKSPKDFYKQVAHREMKELYVKTRWAFRVGLLLSVILLVYGFIARPSGEGQPVFAFVGEHLDNLRIVLEWPRGEFFGIQNFVVDWPIVTRWPVPVFSLASVITYACAIGFVYVIIVLFTYVIGFIGKLLRAREKSNEVFSKDLDDLKVDLDDVKIDGNDLDAQ